MRRRSGLISPENRVDVFMTLCRLLGHYRDDPDKLAVVAEAYHMNGGAWAGDSMPGLGGWEANGEIVRKALYRKNRRVLRAKARGLLIALEVTATDAEFAKLHRTQVDSAVIECRVLPIDERIVKLREKEAAGV